MSTNMILAAAAVAVILSQSATSRADQYPDDLVTAKLVAPSMIGGGGEAYPDIGGPAKGGGTEYFTKDRASGGNGQDVPLTSFRREGG